jgi:hypothetical protein
VKPRWIALAALGLGCAVGCTIDGSLGRADDSTTSETDVGTAASAADGTTSGTGDTWAGSGGGHSGSGSGGGQFDSGGSDTGGTGHPLPVPGEACTLTDHDSDCGICRKEHCCPAMEACAAYDPCFCMWDCLLAPDHNEADCATHCVYAGDTVLEVRTCTEAMCSAVCSDGLDAHPAHDAATG